MLYPPPAFKGLTIFNTGNITSITLPLNAAGDLLILTAVLDISDGNNVVVPNGWSLIRRDDGQNDRGLVSFYKISTGKEPASLDLVADNGVYLVTCFCYSGVDKTNPIEAHAGLITDYANAIPAPDATTTRANSLVLTFYGEAMQVPVNGYIPAQTVRAAVQSGVAEGVALYVTDLAQAVTGPVVARNATLDSYCYGMLSQTLVLSPVQVQRF